MRHEPSSQLQFALALFRRGRFSEVVTTLKSRTENPRFSRNRDLLADALLADALQRIGENAIAQSIALRELDRSDSSSIAARLHFVLGNVTRERGELVQAIEHFQIAAGTSSGDRELCCWAKLRLMSTIGESKGREAALSRFEEVKRALTAFGDSRPFAALHLWLAETEATCGYLDDSRRHLRTAESLLSQIDDVWLKGYLAINSSVVHYYCAEIDEARRAAEMAISYANLSGHCTTRRAAHANLGYLEFATGELTKAEEYFQTALRCCECGSVNEIAILDNIAEIKLQIGDLDGCRRVLVRLDELGRHSVDEKRRHYNAWALQTKVRLMLREGRPNEARKISESLQPLIETLPQARITTETRLLTVETLLDDEPLAAVSNLAHLVCPTSPLPPDLFAEAELVTGKVLIASGAFDLARTHLDRAVHTFKTIGHLVGHQRAVAERHQLRTTTTCDEFLGERVLDRLRALLELRTRAELFAYEAISLLRDLECASTIRLTIDCGKESKIAFEIGEAKTASTNYISIVLGAETGKIVKLSFAPLQDPKSTVTVLSFKRVLEQLIAIESSEHAEGDKEIIWASATNDSLTKGIFFASDAMLQVRRIVTKIASTDVSVLVTGETGVGKEVIARAIHEHSRRSNMPFLALNCAAVPKDLLESQLFGHRKGAFSGAAENHPGIVRSANGGTLFLDEIGELPLDMQAKLLRFLEMSEVHPVGESHPVKVNVRLIFATNGDLEEAVTQNRFRQDLYYRLNVIPIKVPPLRERREEIPVLTNLFAQRSAAEFGKDAIRFSSAAMEQLIVYSWPGNIRQLANEVRRLTALSDSGACITPDDLSPQLRPQGRRDAAAIETGPQTHVRIDQPLDKAIAQLEADMIKHALRQAGGHLSDAASTLGITRKGLYLKRLRLGLADFNERAH